VHPELPDDRPQTVPQCSERPPRTARNSTPQDDVDEEPNQDGSLIPMAVQQAAYEILKCVVSPTSRVNCDVQMSALRDPGPGLPLPRGTAAGGTHPECRVSSSVRESRVNRSIGKSIDLLTYGARHEIPTLEHPAPFVHRGSNLATQRRHMRDACASRIPSAAAARVSVSRSTPSLSPRGGCSHRHPQMTSIVVPGAVAVVVAVDVAVVGRRSHRHGHRRKGRSPICR